MLSRGPRIDENGSTYDEMSKKGVERVEWVTSHIWTSHVTRMTESCPTTRWESTCDAIYNWEFRTELPFSSEFCAPILILICSHSHLVRMGAHSHVLPFSPGENGSPFFMCSHSHQVRMGAHSSCAPILTRWEWEHMWRNLERGGAEHVKWVMSHVKMSRVTNSNGSSRTYEWVMSRPRTQVIMGAHMMECGKRGVSTAKAW